MRLSRDAIVKIMHQTPCVCGSFETWHPECYRGKSQAEINHGYEKAYRAAAKQIRQDAADKTASAISAAKAA